MVQIHDKAWEEVTELQTWTVHFEAVDYIFVFVMFERKLYLMMD